MEDGTYRIDIAATPEDGQASKALVDFLAEAFDVPVSHVTIESGITSRLKRILVVR